MIEGLTRLVDGMEREVRKFEIITNNLANLTTSGFKKDLIEYTNQIENNPQMKELAQKGFLMITDYSQGTIQQSENPFDFAVDGKGFFKIETPQGIKYSRDGGFKLDKNGELVNHNNYFVLDENDKHIAFTKDEFEINRSGEIISGDKKITKIKLVDFENYKRMSKYGNNLYECGEQEELASSGLVVQKSKENSNVNVMLEMGKMIAIMRKYEAYQKVVHFLNESIQTANKEVGRIS